jgi:LacI family transcriptional regulator, galactose operon repressor
MRGARLGGGQQILWGQYNQEHGSRAARELLRTHPRPTAIFAANNFIAVGTMLALREASIRVPGDMSVVAFDDLPPAITFDPFFTVAAQSAYEMGVRATDLLLARLAGTGPAEPQEIVLPIEIIVRRSSGPPPDLPQAGD